MHVTHALNFVLPVLYLDPGSGSFIIQLLIAAVFGAGVAARMYWSRLKGFFTGKRSKPQETTEETDAK